MPDSDCDIISVQDELRAHQYEFTLWPVRWTTYTEMHEWRLSRLANSESGNIPNVPGIYTLLAMPGIANHPGCSYLMYVGKTNLLRRRFGEYLNKERRKTGRPKMFRFLNKYSDQVWFCFTTVDAASLENVENGLKDAFIPPLNDAYSGQLSKVVGAF